MKKWLNVTELTVMMNVQFQVWQGNAEALEALDDTLHAMANRIGMTQCERMLFFETCGSGFYREENQNIAL